VLEVVSQVVVLQVLVAVLLELEELAVVITYEMSRQVR
jgi:hypothetical protein